jgi:HK97 gp10 family phage protein
MSNNNIRFEGLDEILEQIEELADKQNIEAALGKACALVEREAKQKAPKDTGALRRSITSKVEDLQGIVYTPLEYAPYVEYGTGLFAEDGGRMDVPWNYQDDEGNWHSTSGQHPQPFMRPALNENREQILRIIKEGWTKQ